VKSKISVALISFIGR